MRISIEPFHFLLAPPPSQWHVRNLRGRGKFFQGSKLTFLFRSQLGTNRKILVTICQFVNFGRKLILYITYTKTWFYMLLYMQQKSQLILNEVKHKMFKSVVFIVRQTQVLASFPFATSILQTAVLYNFQLAFLKAFHWGHAWPTALHNHIARTSLWLGEEATETISHTVNIVSMCWNTFNFFDSLVISRHYFTLNRKVSCILATICNWFPNKKI